MATGFGGMSSEKRYVRLAMIDGLRARTHVLVEMDCGSGRKSLTE